MIESLMLIALGFLTATLFALIAVQFVWRRAVTVTTRKLTGDLDLEEMQRSTERLAELEVTLQDKQQELATTTRQRVELETALTAASDEAQSLRYDISDLQAQHETARDEAEAHLQNLRTIQVRVDELETAARAEIDKRGLVETQLRSLGEKAARLALEMNEAVSQMSDNRGLETALSAPQVAPVAAHFAREAAAPVTLAPFPADEPEDEALHELAEIKASLTSFSEGAKAEYVPDDTVSNDSDDEPPLPSERFLADRIRALEAGVAS